jgi:tetratricopeptide (TPR) repeat protein
VVYFALGVAQFEQGRFYDAVRQFSRTIELNPGKSRAKELLSLSYLNLGVEEYRNGRKTQALQQFESAVRVDPRNVKAYRNFAVILYETNRLSEAKENLLRGLRLEPKDKEMLSMLVQIYQQQKDFKGALDASEKLHKYYPNNIDIALQLAYLYRFNNEEQKAIVLYQNLLKPYPKEKRITDEFSELYVALSQYEQAIKIYEELLAKSPDSKAVYEDIARIYTEEKKYDEARIAYRKAFQGEQSDSARKDIYHRIAETYIKEGRQNLAAATYREALTQFTDDWDLHRSLALVCENIQPTDAIPIYRRMLETNVGNSYPYVRLGVVFSKLDSMGLAVEHFRKAIELGSRDPLPYYRLSEWSAGQGNIDTAITYEYQSVTRALQQISELKNALLSQLGKSKGRVSLSQTESMNQSGEELQAMQGLLRQGLDSLLRWEKPDILEADLKGFLQKYPGESVLIEYLGLLYEKEGRHDDALSTYKRLVKMDIKNKAGHLGMARIFEKTGRDEDAILAYQRALTIDSGEPQIYESLVRLYDHNGKTSQLADEWMLLAKRESKNAFLLKNLLFLLQRTGREKERMHIETLLKNATPSGE